MIKLKIICVVTTRKVQRWTIGAEEARAEVSHINTVAAVSDGQRIFKFVLFKELASQVKEGKSYIFKNYAVSKFSGQSLLSTRNTKIYMCADVEVPPRLEEEATTLIRPLSRLTPLSEVTVPLDDVTVQGTIVHVSFWRCTYHTQILR